MIVAIDGPAASGKGTIAKAIAESCNLAYLDTGSLYRAVAALMLDQELPLGDGETAALVAANLAPEKMDSAKLRTREVGLAVPIIAAHSDVRAALLETQRRFAHQPPEGKAGVVLDGRDIGTVVCPDADVKLFVTASDEARATRRWLELKQADPDLTVGDVLADLKERDRRDSERASAPLTKADDAILLDTTDLSIEAAIHAALDIVGRR
ncbi:(d)CMP kinase [Pyruvatibacter mobilis]|uniref:(d)CMP kinase n=1 Tax=Pyruvatibacter mobilis TaxID=1712261 RepID=UPI003BAE1A19